jgi:IS605 OrfB family transposase
MENACQPTKNSPSLPAKAEIQDVVYRTIQSGLPQSLAPACRSIARHIRDVHNSSLWLAKTALNCFEKDRQMKVWKLLDELDRPEHWAEALKAFDDAIESANALRAGKGSKLFTKLSSGLNPSPVSTILDLTIFHAATRERIDGLDPLKRSASKRIPANIAKAAREHVRESLSTWLKALKAWRKAPGEAGMPRMPGYQKKGALPAFMFPLDDSTRGFPNLGKFDLSVGEDKAGVLGNEDKEAWAAFKLRAHAEACVAAWAKSDPNRQEAQIKSVRIHAQSKRPKMEIVVAVARIHPAGSFLAELKARHPEDWAKRASDPAALEDWTKELVAGLSWSDVPAHPNAWISENFSAVGADPGQNNLLSLGFSGGATMKIFSGKAFERKMASFDQRIDRLAAGLTTPELRTLAASIQATLNAGGKTALADIRRRQELSQAIHQDGRMLALRRQKQAYSKDQAHRLARAVANAAADAKAAVVVLSRNKGWKQAAGLNAKAERRSHNIPHATLGKLLREKLDALGIVLIETEESYTSQASFVDHDPMPVHAKGAKQEAARARKLQDKLTTSQGQMQPWGQAEKAVLPTEAPASFQRPAQGSAKKTVTPAPACVPKPPPFSGTRDASDRNFYVRQGPLDARGSPRINPHRRGRVPADGQAALNAIRKICPKFACSSKVSLAFDVMRLSFGCWRKFESAQAKP